MMQLRFSTLFLFQLFLPSSIFRKLLPNIGRYLRQLPCIGFGPSGYQARTKSCCCCFALNSDSLSRSESFALSCHKMQKAIGHESHFRFSNRVLVTLTRLSLFHLTYLTHAGPILNVPQMWQQVRSVGHCQLTSAFGLGRELGSRRLTGGGGGQEKQAFVVVLVGIGLNCTIHVGIPHEPSPWTWSSRSEFAMSRWRVSEARPAAGHRTNARSLLNRSSQVRCRRATSVGVDDRVDKANMT